MYMRRHAAVGRARAGWGPGRVGLGGDDGCLLWSQEMIDGVLQDHAT